MRSCGRPVRVRNLVNQRLKLTVLPFQVGDHRRCDRWDDPALPVNRSGLGGVRVLPSRECEWPGTAREDAHPTGPFMVP